jgi:hypothetical protein
MGRKPKSAEMRAKFITARGERSDVEAGDRRGWSVEDNRALLVDPVRRRTATGPATMATLRLSLQERETTSRGLAQKKTLTAIAGGLGRGVTVSREVARNSGATASRHLD